MSNFSEKFLFFFKKIGGIFFDVFSSIGEIVFFFMESLKYLFTGKFYPKIFFFAID